MKKNIIANLAGRFWSILSNFLFIPLYIKYLGFESYSVISFTLMITGVMAILDGGLTATLSREFARKDQTDGDKKRVFRTLESSYFGMVALCILIIFLLSGFIGHNWINVKTISQERISFFLKVMSFEIGFQLLFRFYMGGLLGIEKQVEANLFQIGWGIFRNGLVVLAIMFSPNLETFFIWQTVCTVAFTFLLKLYLEKTLYSRWQFTISPKIEKVVFKRIWQFAGGMMLISLVTAFNTQMDKLTISKVLSIENLGFYTLAVSLAQGLMIIVNPIATALLPRFTAHYSLAERIHATKLFNKSALIISLLVFSGMMVMVFFARDLIWIWTGNPKLSQATHILLPVLAAAYGMVALQLLPYNIAISNGYTKLNNLLGIVSLFITIPGYIFATRLYGAEGAAMVFCCVQLVTTFIYLFFINKLFIQEKFFSQLLLRQMILPMVASAVLFFAVSRISDPFAANRILHLCWIGFWGLLILVVLVVIFLPRQEILGVLKKQKLS